MTPRAGQCRRRQARCPNRGEFRGVVEHRIRGVRPFIEIDASALQHGDLGVGKLGAARSVQRDFEFVDRRLERVVQLFWRHGLQPVEVEVSLVGKRFWLTHGTSSCYRLISSILDNRQRRGKRRPLSLSRRNGHAGLIFVPNWRKNRTHSSIPPAATLRGRRRAKLGLRGPFWHSVCLVRSCVRPGR